MLALAEDAAAADGSAPLSEQFRLSVRSRDHDGRRRTCSPSTTPARSSATPSGAPGADGEPPSAELVVAPDARRRGRRAARSPPRLPRTRGSGATAPGRAPPSAAAFAARPRARARAPPPRHGPLPPLRSARGRLPSCRRGMPCAPSSPDVTRTRGWPSTPRRSPTTPSRARCAGPTSSSGWRSRGGTRPGLILVVDARRPRPARRLALDQGRPTGRARSARSTSSRSHRTGRARVSAATVTVLGLDHLRSLGLDRVVLYVDEENVAAVRTYTALGFTDVEVHRQFARPGGGRPARLAPAARLRRVRPSTSPFGATMGT